MSRTLAELRQDTRYLLDSKSGSGTRWTDAEIDLSINRAAALIGQSLANEGFEWLRSSTTVAITSDTITIPANHGVINVFLDTGSTTYRIKRGSQSGRSFTGNLTGNLTIDYIPIHTTISVDGYTVTYCGVDLNSLVVDQYCSYLAANDLTTKESEINNNIVQQLPVLERAVQTFLSQNQSSPANYRHISTYKDVRYYVASPTTIQLFR